MNKLTRITSNFTGNLYRSRTSRLLIYGPSASTEYFPLSCGTCRLANVSLTHFIRRQNAVFVLNFVLTNSPLLYIHFTMMSILNRRNVPKMCTQCDTIIGFNFAQNHPSHQSTPHQFTRKQFCHT